MGLCPCGCTGVRTKHGFVDKTLAGGAGVVRQALRADDVASAPGLLQRLDARVKLVSLLGLLVAAAFVHHLTGLAALYVLTLALAAMSAIPVRFFVKRVWLSVPVFTGVVVLPATLNVVTHGHVIWSWGSWFGHPVGVTSQGLSAAALIVARVAVSISLVVLLTLTTSWSRLLAALRAVAVPRIFVLVLAMTYRYVFVLLDAVDEMFMARKARTVHAEAAAARGRPFVAASAGALFGRAHALSDEVHQALVARGWSGDARTLRGATVRLVDVGWSVACLAVAAGMLWLDGIVGV
jgi:cobalt ECF transporter T component CbiQ